MGDAEREPAAADRWVVALVGAAERKGRWRPQRNTIAVTLMGGIGIDLRDAQIDAPEIEITAIAVMGGVDIIVPEGVEVGVTGFALMGRNDAPREPAPAGAPVVRVRAFSLMGGVSVQRKPPGVEQE